jgi:hypothetical protein
VTVPPGWVPPPLWTPPEAAPADSSRTLRYHKQTARAVLFSVLGVVLLLVIGSIAAVVSQVNRVTRHVRYSVQTSGDAPPTQMLIPTSAPTPERPRVPTSRLATVSLAQTLPELARLGGSLHGDGRLRIDLAGGAFVAVTFEWLSGHPDHVRQFYLNPPSPHPEHARIRARIEQLLPRQWHGDQWRWEGASLYYAPRGGVLGVSLTGEPGQTERERQLWKLKVSLLWDVVRAAALDLPVKVDAAAVREYLGGGRPLTDLAKVAIDVDVDGAAAEVTRVFPGASMQQRGGLDLMVALDHPWLGQAHLSWRNEKGGRLESVDLRPVKDRLTQQEQLIACVSQAYGMKGREYVSDHLARKRDVAFSLKEGGSVRIYDHLVMIRPRDGFRGRFLSRAGWEKLLGVLDACGRAPR